MANSNRSHENFSRENKVQRGSNRAFGFVFAAFFLIVALFPLIGGGGIRIWPVIVAAIFLAVAVAVPKVLDPLNFLWFKLGLLLHSIVNPVIMALIFFTTVTPIGILMKIFRRTPLALKFDADAASYWIERDPPGPEPDSMPRQF